VWNTNALTPNTPLVAAGLLSVVTNPAPGASFTYGPAIVMPGVSVSFTNNTTPTNFTSILWNFGDGQTSTDPSPVVSHTYAGTGNYTVTLAATNSNIILGVQGTVASAGVTVTYPTPVPSFSFAPSSGTAPLTVTFNNTTPADPANTNSLWSFGDGTTTNTGMSASPAHTYNVASTNMVVLTVENSYGISASFTNPIAVVVTNAAGPVSSPSITRVLVGGGMVTVMGTNGTAGAGYRLMMCTNVAVARSNWTAAASGAFAPDGGFTNQVPVSGVSQFFFIQSP
jgi:PKD repeat protein